MCSWWNSESIAELGAGVWQSQSSTQHPNPVLTCQTPQKTWTVGSTAAWCSSQWPLSHWWGTAINGIWCCGTTLAKGGAWVAGVLYYLGTAPATPLPTDCVPEASLQPRAQFMAISKSQRGNHRSLRPPHAVAWQRKGLHALIHACRSNAIIPTPDLQGYSAVCTQGARQAPSHLLAVSWPRASPFFFPLFPSQAFVSHP